MGKRRRVAERRKTKPAVVGGLIAVAVVGGAFGAYSLYGGGASAEDGTSVGHKAVKSGPPTAAEVTALSTRFLAAWQSGEVAKAAGATTDAGAATTVLTGYTKDAHITGVTVTAGTPSGASVPFSVKATVTYKGKSKPLAYESKLTVARRAEDGVALVDWKPSVVHPDLQDGDRLVTGAAGTPPSRRSTAPAVN